MCVHVVNTNLEHTIFSIKFELNIDNTGDDTNGWICISAVELGNTGKMVAAFKICNGILKRL